MLASPQLQQASAFPDIKEKVPHQNAQARRRAPACSCVLPVFPWADCRLADTPDLLTFSSTAANRFMEVLCLQFGKKSFLFVLFVCFFPKATFFFFFFKNLLYKYLLSYLMSNLLYFPPNSDGIACEEDCLRLDKSQFQASHHGGPVSDLCLVQKALIRRWRVLLSGT